MERKVGEIFEYNGEWYQCVECDSCGKCSLRTTECGSGTKSDIADEVFGACSKVRRTDNKHAIFKKLEKIGEPTMLDGKLVQKILTTDGYSCNGCCFKSPECDKADDDLCCKYEIYVEIKQNKEDMKEKKLNLRPFDLEAAKAGKPVYTRDGRKVRIICFDAKCNKPIVALIQGSDNSEQIEYYTENGVFSNNGITGKNRDLMMLHQKKEGWINIYTCYDGAETGISIYKTKEIAKKEVDNDSSYLGTIKIEWEE